MGLILVRKLTYLLDKEYAIEKNPKNLNLFVSSHLLLFNLQPIRQLLIMPNAKPSAIFLIAINRIAISLASF